MVSVSPTAPEGTEIGVAYDCSYAETGRKVKWFEQGLAFKARQFYTAQHKAGKNPQVINPNSIGDVTMNSQGMPVIEMTDVEPETAVQDTSVKAKSAKKKVATRRRRPNEAPKASRPVKAEKPAKKVAKKKATKKGKVSPANNFDTKDVVWTEKKKTLFRAMGHVGATGKAFRKAADIAKATKGVLTEEQVERQLTPKFELVAQAFVKIADEGEGRTYALTSKGAAVIKSFE